MWVATHGSHTGTLCKVIKKFLFCLALYTVITVVKLMPVRLVFIGSLGEELLVRALGGIMKGVNNRFTNIEPVRFTYSSF